MGLHGLGLNLPGVKPLFGARENKKTTPLFAGVDSFTPRFGASPFEPPALHPRVRAFQNKLKFSLDPFQWKAMNELVAGNSVLVPTPTSSGKTMVAEFAINEVLNPNSPDYGKKLAYTTPRKALSNEKFKDLVKQYGAENIGLMTGDVTINREAPIIVMTTEVLRNMFYDPEVTTREDEITSNMQYAVFDECHFIDDEDRGVVWEESMMYLPPHLQQIHLSATVKNDNQYADWLGSIHNQPVSLLRYETNDPQQQRQNRPVPLQIDYLGMDGALTPVLHGNTQGQSSLFKSKFRMATRKPRNDKDKEMMEAQKKNYGVTLAVKKLQDAKRLPALFFVFSRTGCSGNAREVVRNLKEEGRDLVSANEQVKINAIIDRYKAVYPWLEKSPLLDVLPFGVGYHHGGMLPYEKELVEVLTKKGFLKAVFATDTMAAGINVPVRTVVFTEYDRRVDGFPQKVSDSDCQQIMGRAGRRGMYDIGYVLMMHPKNDKPDRLAEIATAEPNAVNSQFHVSPGMALNLVNTRPEPHAIESLLDKTFKVFQQKADQPFARTGTKKPGTKRQRQRQAQQAAATPEGPQAEFSQMRRFLQKTKFLTSTTRADRIRLSELGDLAARIPDGHNLLIARACVDGLLDKLTPADLATVISTMVVQPEREPKSETYEHSEELIQLLKAIIKPEVAEELSPATLEKIGHLDNRALASMGDLSAHEITMLMSQNAAPEIITALGNMKTVATQMESEKESYPLVNIENQLGLDYITNVNDWCKTGNFDKILRFEKGPGDIVNTLRRTANILRHLSDALDEKKYPQLKANARKAQDLLLQAPLPELVTPKMIDTDI